VYLGNYGLDLVLAGRAEEALPQFRKALSVREAALGPHPSVGRDYEDLGWCLAVLGMYSEARAAFERALSIAPQEKFTVAETLGNLVALDFREGAGQKTQAAFDRALPAVQALGQDGLRPLVQSLVALGFATLDSGGAPSKVADLCARALAAQQEDEGSLSADDVERQDYQDDALRCLGEADLALGNVHAAIPLLERSERRRRRSWPGDLALTRFALARALRQARLDPERATAMGIAARDELHTLASTRPQFGPPLSEVERWLSANAAK
jgi:tetratricopeptide (TPR) repeat protein